MYTVHSQAHTHKVKLHESLGRQWALKQTLQMAPQNRFLFSTFSTVCIQKKNVFNCNQDAPCQSIIQYYNYTYYTYYTYTEFLRVHDP